MKKWCDVDRMAFLAGLTTTQFLPLSTTAACDDGQRNSWILEYDWARSLGSWLTL